MKRFERERRILDHNITLIDKALQQTVFSWYCPNLKSTKSLWKTGCAMMTRPSKQICFESTRHHEVNKAVTDDLQRFDLNPEIRKFPGHRHLRDLSPPPHGQMEELAAPFWVAANCDLCRFYQQKAQQ